MNLEKLILVGLNHQGLPVRYLEEASVPREELLYAILYLPVYAGLEEVTVLSTCDRVEIVGLARDANDALHRTKDWLLGRIESSAAPAVYAFSGEDAVRHLFRVSAGLDSRILGEAEALSQVREAYRFASEHGGTGKLLDGVFGRAISAARTVRSQTGGPGLPRSISALAAVLAKRTLGETQHSVVVFGAGRAAGSVARQLSAQGLARIKIANRTLEDIAPVAGPLGAGLLSLEQGFQELETAAAAVFATASRKPILTAAMLKRHVSGRGTSLHLIDLGLPRNVEAACAELHGVRLYNLDGLKTLAQEIPGFQGGGEEEAGIRASIAAGECCAELGGVHG